MRARHRHFKYSSAAASAAFDSRYIHGESDGNTIQTWSDRSGNGRDAIQATAADRPTYKTAIQGGNAILRFDSDFLTANFGTGTAFSYYLIFARTGSPVNSFGNAAFVASAGRSVGTATGDRRWQFAYANASPNNLFLESSNASSETSRTRNDNWNIHSLTAPIGTGTKRNFINGGGEQTANVSTQTGVTTGTIILRIGERNWATDFASGDFRLKGDIGLLATYEESHSAALRRRLEHAAAYSFKIACS